MKTNSMILALVSALSLGTTARVAQAQEGHAPKRGTVEVKEAARAIVTGPVAIHAYSAFSGASVFVVNAVTGTDRDCLGTRTVAATSIAADQVQMLTVGAGQVACVATTNARGSELLWHAQKDGAPAPMMLVSR